MTRHVAIHKDASAEADAAASRYEHELPGLGSQFIEELERAIENLQEGILPGMPWQGALARRGVKYILLQRFPFKIVFVDRDDGALVLAIAHHSRRPAYWLERM